MGGGVWPSIPSLRKAKAKTEVEKGRKNKSVADAPATRVHWGGKRGEWKAHTEGSKERSPREVTAT